MAGMTSGSAAPAAAGLASDLTVALASVFDPLVGGTGPLVDISMQCKSGEPIKAHALVLYARCRHLHQVCESGGARMDCGREELLHVLTFLYLGELPASSDAATLICLRALSQQFELPTLDTLASRFIAGCLTPAVCCEVVREVSREESRARPSNGMSSPSPTCATLKEACAAHARASA